MIAVLQRVSSGAVRVGNSETGRIGIGLVILLGVAADDAERDADWLAEKTAQLRIFKDAAGKLNCSLQEVRGSALVISQFTLLANCKKGRRPSFIHAAGPEKGEQLYEYFSTQIGRASCRERV